MLQISYLRANITVDKTWYVEPLMLANLSATAAAAVASREHCSGISGHPYRCSDATRATISACAIASDDVHEKADQKKMHLSCESSVRSVGERRELLVYTEMVRCPILFHHQAHLEMLQTRHLAAQRLPFVGATARGVYYCCRLRLMQEM